MELRERGLILVDLSIAEAKLTLHVQGADKLWWYYGMKMPGTSVPGVITAGTFYQDGKRVFWDVLHSPEMGI